MKCHAKLFQPKRIITVLSTLWFLYLKFLFTIEHSYTILLSGLIFNFSCKFKTSVSDFFALFSYRIGPFEVESALMEHPAVVEVAVVSSPDEERGEVSNIYLLD